jgi:4-amino-4-deoxy-L-arabinose transferase-like glycosyltransferase
LGAARLCRARLALLGAALMAAAVLLGVEARIAKTDALLAACAVATMGALARAWLDWTRSLAFVPSRHNWLVFWSATALALLIKGPIVPMVWGLAALVLSLRERSLRWFAPLKPGCGACCSDPSRWCCPGSSLIFGEDRRRNLLRRLASASDMLSQARGGPGVPLARRPASICCCSSDHLLALGCAARRAWRRRSAWRETARARQIQFLLAWLVPSWLVFEAVPTKLPHYVLPLYPAITALLLLALVNGGINRFRRGSALTAFLVVLVPAALVGVLLYGTWTLDRTLPWLALPVLALALFVAFRGFLAFRRGAFEGALWRGVVASLLLSAGVYGLASPSLRGLKLSPRLAEAVQAVTCPNPQIITVGYREPSLVFLVGTDLRMGADGSVAATFLREPGCRVALVEGRFLDGFRQTLAASGLAPRLLTTISGFNLNGGKRLDISVFVRE